MLTYLFSTMGEDRLVGFAHLACNRDVSVDTNTFIRQIITDITTELMKLSMN